MSRPVSTARAICWWLVVCLALLSPIIYSTHATASSGGRFRPTAVGPNVSWGYTDRVTACPAGDSVVAGHPCRLRISITYNDDDGGARAGVPPESIYVTTRIDSGTLVVCDQDTILFATDATDNNGLARIQSTSFSGNGKLHLTLHVASTTQGQNTVYIRTVDTDHNGRVESADRTGYADINYSGAANSGDDSLIAVHLDHWHRNALHSALYNRTHFTGTDTLSTWRLGEGGAFWSPSGKYLALSAHDTIGNFVRAPCHVYLMTSEITGSADTLRRITHSTGRDYDPFWSPRNNLIVYGRQDTAIFAQSPVGFGGTGEAGEYKVAGHANSAQPPRGATVASISPDGAWIAYTARDSNPAAFVVHKRAISGDAATDVKLTAPPSTSYEDWCPKWSPDGKWIIFQRHDNGASKYYIERVRADGDYTQTPEAVYTNAQGKDTSYTAVNSSYSPDSAIVLMGLGPANTDNAVFLNTIDPTLSAPRAIANYAEAQYSSQEDDPVFAILDPSLSPDGTRVALTSSDVYVGAGGSKPTRRGMKPPPYFTDIGGAITDTTAVVNKTVLLDHTLTFTASASDSAGESVTHGAAFLPDGATFSPSTHSFSWTPTEDQCGSDYWVKFMAHVPSGGSDAVLCKISVISCGSPMRAGEDELANRTPGVQARIGPNPTRGTYLFPAASAVGARSLIEIFDLVGRRVAAIRTAPSVGASWDGRDLHGTLVGPGVYLYRMEQGSKRTQGRIVVVR